MYERMATGLTFFSQELMADIGHCYVTEDKHIFHPNYSLCSTTLYTIQFSMTATIRQEETGRGGMMMSVTRAGGGGGALLHLVATHSWVENAALWRQ